MKPDFAEMRRCATVLLSGLAVLFGCTDGGSFTGTHAGVSQVGEVVVAVADNEDGTTTNHYSLRMDGADEDHLQLSFAHDPRLAPGERVRVFGTFDGHGILQVIRLDALAPTPSEIESSRRALINSPPRMKRRVAFVLVDLGNGVNLSAADAQERVFGANNSVQPMKQTVLEYSFGRQDIEGQVVGPLSASISGCNYDALAAALRPQVPGTFDNYIWYFGSRVASCGWLGVAKRGRVNQPEHNLWLNANATCRVATHEFGHNLGLLHAARMRCGAAPFHDSPTGNCTHSEYGDNHDVMGDGCGHFNAYAKASLRFLERCNGVRVRSSAKFTVFAVEKPCNAIQMLQIPMPKPRTFRSEMLRYYYLELNSGAGFNAGAGLAVDVRVAGDIVSPTQWSRQPWILDMNPSTTVIDGLKAGGSFEDPAGGVKFTVDSIDAEKAVISVEMANPVDSGEHTCLDDTVVRPPGFAACNASDAPGPVTSPADGGPAVGRDGGAEVDTGSAGRDAPGGADTGGTGTGDSRTDVMVSADVQGQNAPDGGAPSPTDAAATASDTARPPGATGGPVAAGCACRLAVATAPGGAFSASVAFPLIAALGLFLRRRRRRVLTATDRRSP